MEGDMGKLTHAHISASWIARIQHNGKRRERSWQLARGVAQ
jgi:hypothetical protein